MSKATISKAIKNWKNFGFKDETGTFRIDPSELHRVYRQPFLIDMKKPPFPQQ